MMLDLIAMQEEAEAAIKELYPTEISPDLHDVLVILITNSKKLYYRKGFRDGQTALTKQLVAKEKQIGEQAARNLQIDQEEQAAHMIGI